MPARKARPRVSHTVATALPKVCADVTAGRGGDGTVNACANGIGDRPTAFFGDGELIGHDDRFDLAIDDAPLGLLAPVAADAAPLLGPAAQEAC